jgi:hypothetical protein
LVAGGYEPVDLWVSVACMLERERERGWCGGGGRAWKDMRMYFAFEFDFLFVLEGSVS